MDLHMCTTSTQTCYLHRLFIPFQECNIIATEKLFNAAPLWRQLGVPHRALWGRRKWLLPWPCKLRWSRCLADWMLGCCQHNEFEHLDLHRTYRQYRVMWIQMVMHWELGCMDGSSLRDLAPPLRLVCGVCGKPSAFLLQIFVPTYGRNTPPGYNCRS